MLQNLLSQNHFSQVRASLISLNLVQLSILSSISQFIDDYYLPIYDNLCLVNKNIGLMQLTERSVSKIYENSTNNNPEQYSPHKLKAQKTSPVRIQIINQNLQQAIIDVKNSVKNKMWKKDLDQVTQQYKNAKQQIQNDKKEGIMKQKFEPILCTEVYKRKYEEQLKQIKAKREQLQIKSLEKQMTAKLQRKINQNRQMREKMRLIKDLNDKKRQIQQAKVLKQQKKKEEHQFLHGCNNQRFSMLKDNKRRMSIRQLKDSRIVQQESWKEMKFKAYIAEKNSQQRHQLMKTKQQFMIRSQSQGTFKKGINDVGSNPSMIATVYSNKFNQRDVDTAQRKRNIIKEEKMQSHQTLKDGDNSNDLQKQSTLQKQHQIQQMVNQ